MWRALTLVLTLFLQSTAWPERHPSKVHGETGEVHGCWAENDYEVVECEFPFEYQGTDHNKCLPYGSGFWCATTRRYTDNPSKWGYCNQCDRTKYWKTEMARSGHFSENESSEEASCVVGELTGCSTCKKSGGFGGSCKQSFKYDAINYGGCDASLKQDGKPWCLYSDDANDWGYCNPSTCKSQKAVGFAAVNTATKSGGGTDSSDSAADTGGNSDNSNNSGNENSNNSAGNNTSGNSGDSGWKLSETGKDRQVPANEYYTNGRPAKECVGGSLLFEPRPCDRDCRTVMGIHVNCDSNIRGCGCEKGKFWAENQGRCVEEAECREQDVFRVKRPCGQTYRGLFRCQYPFTYDGKEYNTCAKWKGRDWCSLDPGAYEVHRRWGYCEGLMGRDENKCPVAPEV